MTRPLVLAVAVVAVLGAACTSTSATPTPVPTTSPVAVPGDDTPAPVETPAATPLVGSWAPDTSVELPEGWTLRDCEGDAPLVCVDHDGAIAGTLILDSFPLDKGLAAAEGRDALVAALRANADARMQGLVDDRSRGCADQDVTADEPTEVDMDGLPGVRSGIRGVQDGELVEHVVTYATAARGQLWLLVAESARDGSCMDDPEMDLFVPATLDAFLPVLDRVVAGTPLPAAGTRVEPGTILGIDGGLDGGRVVAFVGGELHRIQQPRPMTLDELEAAGVTVGAPVVHVDVSDTSAGSWFAVVPPTGAGARLHLVVDQVAHPVVIQTVTSGAVEGIPAAASPALDRVVVAG